MTSKDSIVEQYMADNGGKKTTVGGGAKINAIGGGTNPKSGVTYEIVFEDDKEFKVALGEFKNKKGFPESTIMLWDADAEQMRRLGLFAFDERCEERWDAKQRAALKDITVDGLAAYLKKNKFQHLAVGAPVEIVFDGHDEAIKLPTLTFVE